MISDPQMNHQKFIFRIQIQAKNHKFQIQSNSAKSITNTPFKKILQSIIISQSITVIWNYKSKPEKGGTPISTPMRTRAFRISPLPIFPLSSASKSVNKFSDIIAKSSSSSKNNRRIFPSNIDITSGSSKQNFHW